MARASTCYVGIIHGVFRFGAVSAVAREGGSETRRDGRATERESDRRGRGIYAPSSVGQPVVEPDGDFIGHNVEVLRARCGTCGRVSASCLV